MARGFALRNHHCLTGHGGNLPQTMLRSSQMSSRLVTGWVALSALTGPVTNPPGSGLIAETGPSGINGSKIPFMLSDLSGGSRCEAKPPENEVAPS